MENKVHATHCVILSTGILTSTDTVNASTIVCAWLTTWGAAPVQYGQPIKTMHIFCGFVCTCSLLALACTLLFLWQEYEKGILFRKSLKERVGGRKSAFVISPEWTGNLSLSVSHLCSFRSSALPSHLSQIRAIQRSNSEVLCSLNILLVLAFSVRSSVSCFMSLQWLWQFVSPEKSCLQ